MKKRFSLFLIVVLFLALAVVGCKKPTPTPEPDPEPEVEYTTVTEALAGANNSSVEFKGVVFAKTNDGIYVADNQAGAYVKLATSQQDKFAAVKVGDELGVTGKLSVSAAQVFVKNASVEVLSSDKTVLTASEKTIGVVAASSASDKATFGKLFKVTGAVTLDEANRMVWSDESGKLYIDDACKNDFASYVGKKVTANVTLLNKGTEGWVAYAYKDTASEYIVDIDTVKEDIFNSISVTEEVWGVLDLTTSYATEPGVKFEWSVKSGEGVTITNNECEVSTSLTADSNVVLTLTISAGSKTASKDYNTLVKAITNASIAEAKASTGYVVVNGVVVATAIANESNTNYWIIMMDETTHEYLVVDAAREQKNSVTVGDKIQVVGKYENVGSFEDAASAVDTKALTDVKAVKVTGKTTVNFEELYTKELRTVEDYQEAANTAHQQVVLYKVINPWMVGSGSTTYSWYQFGPTKDFAANGIQNKKQCAFLIANFAANGLTTFDSQYNIPNKSQGAQAYDGSVMYAFSMYQFGATRWPFVVPNAGASFYDVSEAVKSAIEVTVENEITATEAGKIDLVDKVMVGETEYAVTWTSSDDTKLNVTTGAYPQLFEEATVTLTAKFTCNQKEYELEIKVKMIAAEVVAVDVSTAIAEAAASQDGTKEILKLEAYVAAIGTSSENSEEYRNGIMLTDGKKVIYYGKTEYEIGEHKIKAGDKLSIKKANLTVTEDGAKLVGGDMELLSENNTIDYTQLELAATVSNDEELATFLAAHNPTNGLVVKFTGTFNFVGTGSTAKNPRYQLNYKAAASSANARYPFKDYTAADKGNRSVVFSLNASKELMPENEWWVECGIPQLSGSKCFTVCGTVYAVGGYYGNTMHAWTIINPDQFEITVPNALIQDQMDALLSVTEFSAVEAGTFTLPTEVKYNGEGKATIAWESSDSTVMANDGTYAAVSKDTTITLTAKATVAGKEYTKTFEVTLKAAAAKVLTVSEVLESTDETIAAFTATVAGVSTGTSGTVYAESGTTYPTIALYLTDGVKVMGMDKFAGAFSINQYDVILTSDETQTTLKVGDIITVKNVAKAGSAVQCSDATTAEKTGAQEGTDWFTPVVAESNVIDSQDDIAALMLTITANSEKCSTTHAYEVYKIVGTAENPLYIGRASGYMMSFFYKTETNKAATKISATAVTPGTGYTIGSGKTCYFGTHGLCLAKAIGNDAWAIENTVISEISATTQYGVVMTAGDSIFSYGYTGTMYIIKSNTGSSSYPYIMYGVLGAGLTLNKVA